MLSEGSAVLLSRYGASLASKPESFGSGRTFTDMTACPSLDTPITPSAVTHPKVVEVLVGEVFNFAQTPCPTLTNLLGASRMALPLPQRPVHCRSRKTLARVFLPALLCEVEAHA